MLRERMFHHTSPDTTWTWKNKNQDCVTKNDGEDDDASSNHDDDEGSCWNRKIQSADSVWISDDVGWNDLKNQKKNPYTFCRADESRAVRRTRLKISPTRRICPDWTDYW